MHKKKDFGRHRGRHQIKDLLKGWRWEYHLPAAWRNGDWRVFVHCWQQCFFLYPSISIVRILLILTSSTDFQPCEYEGVISIRVVLE
jgi:hypothetical protein